MSYQEIQDALGRMAIDTPDRCAAAMTLLVAQPDSSEVRDAVAELQRRAAALEAAPPPAPVPAPAATGHGLVGTPAEAMAAERAAEKHPARAHR